jgi:CheY-like chemotaxis protein
MTRTILIVDDDPALRETLSAILESEGYEPVMASDGLDALEKLGEVKPAVMLLDMAMPRLDGQGLIEELERQGRRKGIPIVVLTADSHAQQKATAVGADGYVEKPFRIPALLDEIDRLVPK